MKLLFWLSCIVTAYAYFGYVILLALIARRRPQPILSQPIQPAVSILIAAKNEESHLPAKLADLRLLKYPRTHLQIIIVSDGSTDRTPEILREHAHQIEPLILEQSNGKAFALNQAVSHATGRILVFLDTRQSVERDAIIELVACFADPAIGAVSGELLLETSASQPTDALGIYWKIEKIVRKLESASGSVVGVTGAIYAIRRDLYTPMPTGTILDDVFVPMHVARTGHRVVFQPSAIARDSIFAEKGKEFSRKVRTLTGNYQLLRLAPWMFSPSNPLFFRFFSHKILRLWVPMLLCCIFVSSAVLTGPLYRVIFWFQIIFYIAAICGVMWPPIKRFRPVGIASTFVMLNAAAALAFYNFAVGKKKIWAR